MYKTFRVQNFRCFRDLTLADLARVNLIAGKNNAGKTALLEAFFLHCGGGNPELALRVNVFRMGPVMKFEVGRWADPPWESLFHRFDGSREISLTGVNASGFRNSVKLRTIYRPEELAKVPEPVRLKTDRPEEGPLLERTHVLEVRYEAGKERRTHRAIVDPTGLRIEPIPPQPAFPAFFRAARVQASPHDEAERYGKLEVHGQHEIVLEALRVIEPRLRRLAMVVWAGQPLLHGDVGIGRLVPLSLMGEGMVRLASLIIEIASAPGGVVLVDEIENGLHHSVLEPVWSAVAGAARKFDTQILATTHSYECIAAAHRAFAKAEPYDFRLHRLDRVGEDIKAVTFDRESMETVIEGGLEVR